MKLTATALGLALALTVSEPCPAAAADPAIRQATEKMIGQIERNQARYRASPSQFYAMVDATMLPYFDLTRIGQVTLGPQWAAATPAQRKRLTATFKSSLIHSYADAVLEQHDGLTVEWMPADAGSHATDPVLSARLTRNSGPPTRLDFVLTDAGRTAKIYDVAVDGVSLAAGLRSQFKSEIARSGLEGLIRRLEAGPPPR